MLAFESLLLLFCFINLFDFSCTENFYLENIFMAQEKYNQKKLKRTHRKVVFFPRKMSKIISRNAVIFENIMHFTLVNCTHMT